MKNKTQINGRKKAIILLVGCLVLLISFYILGFIVKDDSITTNFSMKNQLPSLKHLFGTDWMGRDMLLRTIKGLHISVTVGLFASLVSSVIAVILGIVAATMGKTADTIVLFLIDMFQGVPHLILLIFLSVICNRGMTGIMVSVALTHWTSLARLVRSDIISLKTRQYIITAKCLGVSKTKIAVKHILPHIVGEFIAGVVLMFPHAILHESSLTFLGFGIPPEKNAVGVILSESMKYLTTGNWHLCFFPGLCLTVLVLLFDVLGQSVNKLLKPQTYQQ